MHTVTIFRITIWSMLSLHLIRSNLQYYTTKERSFDDFDLERFVGRPNIKLPDEATESKVRDIFLKENL